jgi:hypothetical protein
MLGSAIVYSAVLLGPWGQLKTSAYQVGTFPWLVYALGFFIFVFALLPGSFGLTLWAGRRLAGEKSRLDTHRLRSDFIQMSYALIPLGLAAWMAFTLSFVFANLSYLWPVLSDPLARGWNLFGMSSLAWTPYFSQFVPALQAVVLAGGFAWTARLAVRISGQVLPPKDRIKSTRHVRLALPVVLFGLAVVAGLMSLLIL